MKSTGEITELLGRLRDGDRYAIEELIPLLYGELRRLARHHLKVERAGHTLEPTALVNEAYLRLIKNRQVQAENRTEFFAVASTTMRRVLVDHARARKRLKRGAGQRPVPLDEADAFMSDRQAGELLSLAEALERLSEFDPRAGQVVDCRFFGGLSLEETAAFLQVSVKTVQRSWIAARAWLRKEVAGDLLG